MIAPAKKMVVAPDDFAVQSRPQGLPQTQQILARLRQLSYDQAKTLWHCSDKLARPNYDWLQRLDLTRELTPALMAYSGIQYQYMAPDLFTAPALAYAQENLRILSGFYGSLRPFDGVVPYRLEMQAKLSVAGAPNLYAFWGDRLYRSLHFDQGPVVNLASQEYAKAITPYLKPTDQLIEVIFGRLVAGRVKVTATRAKMARGAMVRYLAEQQVTDVAGIRRFKHPAYRLDDQRSTDQRLVFLDQR